MILSIYFLIYHNILRFFHKFYFFKDDGLFFSSKAPGLVRLGRIGLFSNLFYGGVRQRRINFAPSAFPSTGPSAVRHVDETFDELMSRRSGPNGSGLRLPPLISYRKDSTLRLSRVFRPRVVRHVCFR